MTCTKGSARLRVIPSQTDTKPYAMLPGPIFQTLPNELLISIILWLDSPRDLLHLSLTNRFFFEIIVPNILYFTSISCDLPSRIPIVWKTLKDQPHLAKQIRSLDVISEEDYTRLTSSGYKSGFRINAQTWSSIWHSNPLLKFDKETIKVTNIIGCMEKLSFLTMKISLTDSDLRDILKNLMAFCSGLKMLSLQWNILADVPRFAPIQVNPVGDIIFSSLSRVV